MEKYFRKKIIANNPYFLKKKRPFLGSNICEKWDPRKHLRKISTASSTHHIKFPSVVFLSLKLITKYEDVETKRLKHKPYFCIHHAGSECHNTAQVPESWRHVCLTEVPSTAPYCWPGSIDVWNNLALLGYSYLQKAEGSRFITHGKSDAVDDTSRSDLRLSILQSKMKDNVQHRAGCSELFKESFWTHCLILISCTLCMNYLFFEAWN